MNQRKVCSYKGCTSKQGPGITSNVTLFQFPRDEARHKLWIELSRCENKDDPVKYLCSKHFDERKYISRNPRRLLLLAHAVPYAYESDTEEEINETEVEVEDEQIQVVTSQYAEADYLMPGMDFGETECNYAESTINEVEYVQDEPPPPTKSYENSSKKRKWDTDPETSMILNVTTNEAASKVDNSLKRVKVPKASAEEETIAKNSDELEDLTLDNPDITTFIFKGEEYIQMPKSVFLEQRNKLLNNIQDYKDLLMSIKSQIDLAKM